MEHTADSIKKISDLTLAAKPHQAIEHTHHLVIPDGYKHIDISQAIENALPSPTRKKNNLIVHDLQSLLQYAKDQSATQCGYIYADIDQRTITAVFNDQKDAAQTGWRDHRVTYKAEFSREFSTWMGRNEKPFDQEEFAIFLEDNIADVPNGENLLAVALSLQAKTDVSFSSSRRLDNGQIQFSYTENIDARAANGAIEVPREFTLGMRIFKNGEGYELKARLKYRLNSSKLKFWYEIDRPENSVEHAFKLYIDQLCDCGYTVLLGKP